MDFKAILFDLDGTLWDSYPLYSQIVSQRSDVTIQNVQDSLEDNVPIARLLRKIGINTATQLSSILKNYPNKHFLYKGADKMLESIESRGVPLGIVTSLPKWIATPLLDWSQIQKYFSCLVHYGSTRKHKPRPDPIKKALSELNLTPSPSVMYIGDSEVDLQAALSSGIQFTFASFGYGHIKDHGYTRRISCLSEVLELLPNTE